MVVFHGARLGNWMVQVGVLASLLVVVWAGVGVRMVLMQEQRGATDSWTVEDVTFHENDASESRCWRIEGEG